jgi:phenylacetate-CoA ligase
MRSPADPGAVAEEAAVVTLALAEHSRRTVPYYRDLYGSTRFEDLGSIPPSDKGSMVARSLEDRVSGPIPVRHRRIVTSGTTGVPMSAVYSPGLARWFGLLNLRHRLQHGVRPNDRIAALTFAVDTRSGRGLAARLLQRRIQVIPLDADVNAAAEQLIAGRPRVLHGHPHRLLDIGAALAGRWQPEMLFSHGEALDPVMRSSLERVYGTAPRDGYGTTEAGPVAHQCPARDLHHVHWESVLVEILDDDDRPVPSGQRGNVVITSLPNRLMPFIRYRMADVATLADRPCACGYTGPALTQIIGRSTDFALDGQGHPISPELLWLYTHVPSAAIEKHVRRYQVHQRSDGTIEVRLELRSPLPEGLVDETIASYRRVTGGRPVVVRIMDDLGEARAGKFRLISSELAAAPT